MRLPNFRTGLEAEAGRQRRAWQFFSFWTSAAWISNGLPVFQFYLQISGFCWAKTCFQWQHVLFFSSLAPGGLNFHRFSNFCSKIHCFRRYKTAIFPLTLGTLDFLFFEHSFQIQRFEGQVLKSVFFSTPDTLDCQIAIAFPFSACFTGCAEAIFQIEDVHDSSIKRTARKLVFWIFSIWHGGCWWNIFYLKILPDQLLWNFEIPKKHKKATFVRGVWRFFLKSTQKLKLQQCPSEDLKVLLLGLSSLTVKPSQIPQNLAIPVQIPSDRFYRQIYSPRATWCDCTNFYLKWLRATPKLATSIWTNRWISSILASWNIYFLPFWHFSQQVLT